jgi:hypothetical protein
MSLFGRIAEERIARARDEGAFENLPGKGRPFEFEDDSFVPEELRLTWKILKNSDCVPPEIELRKEVFSLRQLIEAATDPEERLELRRALNRVLLNIHVARKW